MFRKSLALSAVFASLAIAIPADESDATPIVPIRDKHQVELLGSQDTGIYKVSDLNNKARGYQVAPQFLVIQDFDGSSIPLAQVDLYAQDVFGQWNDLSGEPQPFFNFVSPLKAADIEVERLNVSSIGSGSSASGDRSSAFGIDAKATGSSSTAIGDGSTASGNSSSAFGSNAKSTHTNSTAIGVGSTTSRANQLVLGNKTTDVTIPSLASDVSGVISAEKDGTLRKLDVSGDQLETTINQTVPSLEKAARGLGLAMQTSGAIGAAMSAVPELTLQEDEPIRCAIGVGGYGSQYATAGGCALRIKDRIQLNGAISYAPSIDYVYGSTSSIAGRLGISFPLGAKSSNDKTMKPIEIDDLLNQIKNQSKTIEEQKAEIDSLRSDMQVIYEQLGIVPGNLSSKE